MNKTKVIYSLETNDPDDYFNLAFLCSHPQIDLKGVTICPGSPEQVGIVKHVLSYTGKTDVLVGVPDPKQYTFKSMGANQIVSNFHYKVIKQLKPNYSAIESNKVFFTIIKEHPDVVVITGGPVTDVATFLKKYPNMTIAKWVGQGGFAGDNVVAEEDVLPKFKGKTSCRTFNFCQDSASANFLLETDQIKEKVLVSKNVCHGMYYDKALHEKMKAHRDKYKGLELIVDGMEIYLEGKPKGKLFHDPLASTVIVDNTVCDFKRVKLFYKNGEYGAELDDKSDVIISVKADKEKFFKVLSCQ